LSELQIRELGESLIQDEDGEFHSNLESLEAIIHQTKAKKLPVISVSQSNSISQKVVNETCEMLNEEYIQKIELLSKHINTRLRLLADLKKEQRMKLQEIKHFLFQQNTQSSQLSEKTQEIVRKLSLTFGRWKDKEI
jgi:hypothetical protein